MAVGRITKSTVSSLIRPATGKHFLWDDKVSNFGVYITSTGKITYVLQYRMGGRGTPTRRYTIGRHGSPWTPDTARDRATELLFDIRRGTDPILAERKTTEAIAIDESLRLSAYLDTWMTQHVEPKGLRSGAAMKRALQRDVLPFLGHKLITEITKRDIVKRIDALTLRNKSAANHALEALRALLNFAKRRSDLDTNPLDGMSRPHAHDSRTRKLLDWELQRVWEAAHDLRPAEGAVIKLFILTGQRHREVTMLDWSELELSDRTWTLPANRSKNKREHLMPLTTSVVRIIEEFCPAIGERRGPVFPKGGGAHSPGPLKKRLDAAISRRINLAADLGGQSGVNEKIDFTFHDLRRTAATGMQRLKVPVEVTEAILNHVTGSRSKLIDTYQLYRYFDEKAEALSKWADFVAALMQRDDAWPGGKKLPPID